MESWQIGCKVYSKFNVEFTGEIIGKTDYGTRIIDTKSGFSNLRYCFGNIAYLEMNWIAED